tara:strand:- start:3094 stop:3732 length:639 start_codon:yes stop_codon:yes gene_type:complete
MPELGKISKPSVDRFKNKKRLIYVPIFFVPPQISDIKENNPFKDYWAEIADNINKLELSLGKIDIIFHEMNTKSKEDGLNIIENLNPDGIDFIKILHNSGSTISDFENEELITELMDWQRALSSGIISAKARETISKEYNETNSQRNKNLLDKISQELNVGSNGILFMREDHGLQFDNETEVFYVSSNTISKVHEWLKVEIEKLMNPSQKEN